MTSSCHNSLTASIFHPCCKLKLEWATRQCTRESCASVLLQQLCSVYPGRAMIAVVSIFQNLEQPYESRISPMAIYFFSYRGLLIDLKPSLNCTCTPSRNDMSIQIIHSYGKWLEKYLHLLLFVIAVKFKVHVPFFRSDVSGSTFCSVYLDLSS